MANPSYTSMYVRIYQSQILFLCKAAESQNVQLSPFPVQTFRMFLYDLTAINIFHKLNLFINFILIKIRNTSIISKIPTVLFLSRTIASFFTQLQNILLILVIRNPSY